MAMGRQLHAPAILPKGSKQYERQLVKYVDV
jgi:hypothetical protein